ncbi:MAG: cytochrome c biogenesis protein ResB [Actinomycetales bacterium]|nr:cytochrome c biogenesis protein ResB [Actinomycetales bacterium]
MPTDLVDAMSPATAPPGLPRLGAAGWLRWVWRQLTSMRVALMLLTLLAVVAVPGSLLPQRPQDPAAVARWIAENPGAGAWLDRLGFFDVFASPWFSAVYLLLFASLVGCIVPRIAAHARALRAAPPRAPRRFERFAVRDEVVTTASADDVLAAARAALAGPVRRLPRFRVVEGVEDSGTRTLSAERGYLRETGNLLFHLALVALLVAVAVGQLFHYRGQAIVVEGRGFANSVTDYDTFVAGTAFDPGSLVPFTLTLDEMVAEFAPDGRPVEFRAAVTVREPGAHPAPRPAVVRLNDPLEIGGAKVYLQGNGYAPEVTVRDAAGEVAFAGAVPFLPEDDVYTSRGVIKVPDVSTGDQLGLVGYLLPTAVVGEMGAASVHPDPAAPLLVLTLWRGDLGLDTGVPQNVYELDTARMTQVLEADGTPTTILVQPGETVELPDGLGTLTWDGLPRFAALDLRHDPALGGVLAGAIAALVGLGLSLFTPRRRIWVRATEVSGTGVREAGVGGTGVREGGPGQRTVVGLAGLARGDDLGLPAELARVADAVRALGEAAAVVAGDVGSAGDGTAPQRSAGARDDEGRGDGPG